MIIENIDFHSFLIPLFGYLEMHYRFPFFPYSRYFRKEPEIYSDAPHRVNPDEKLPISIIVKDADKYPIYLNSVSIKIKSHGSGEIDQNITINKSISERWFDQIFNIDVSTLSGNITIWVTINILVNGKNRSIINHNVKTTGSFLLKSHIDHEMLPASNKYWWGDLHYHSNYTEDYVEFGATLSSTQSAAKALGLCFVAITDHSYDLDDKIGSWTDPDPKLEKWKLSRAEIKEVNKADKPLLIPGEEVTVRNTKNNNIHLLVLNHPEYIPGSGDGAERFFHTRSEHTADDVLESLNSNAIAIAAHPFMFIPFLQRLLLKRSSWEQSDCDRKTLSGFQIVNGADMESIKNGVRIWSTMLLSGKRTFIYAGNDAHGNFNRFHQIRLPMWSTHTNYDQIFGQYRTGILQAVDLSIEQLIQQLKSGKCVVSNGPSINIYYSNNTSVYSLGDTIISNNINFNVECISSLLFGELDIFNVYQGIIGDQKEFSIFEKQWDTNSYSDTLEIPIKATDRDAYIRCELYSGNGKFCFTNPIWISPKLD